MTTTPKFINFDFNEEDIKALVHAEFILHLLSIGKTDDEFYMNAETGECIPVKDIPYLRGILSGLIGYGSAHIPSYWTLEHINENDN